MKRLLYDFPFFFAFNGILFFSFYKIDSIVGWIFFALFLTSILRIRVFILATLFLLALYISSAPINTQLQKTDGTFKGVVYDIRKNRHLTFYVKTEKAKIMLFASGIYDNIDFYDNIFFKAKLTNHIKNKQFREYLHSEGIKFIGYASYIKKINSQKNITSRIQTFRAKIEREFYYFLGNKEYLFLQNAIFGDSKNKSKIKNIFVNTQTAHIMSVSGLHIGFVFGLFYVLFYFLFSEISFIYKRFKLKIAASIFALAPSLAYFVISGMHIPAIRSFAMVLIFALALIYGHIKNSYNILFFVASLTVLFFGYPIVFNPSFVMSFFMSFTAIYLYGLIKKYSDSKIVSYILFSLSIGIFAMPVSAFYFHKVAYLSFVSNFIVVPYFGFIVMPLSFVSMAASFMPIFFIKHIVFSLLNSTTSLLLQIVNYFSFFKPLHIDLKLYMVVVLYMAMFLTCELLRRVYFKKISTSSK